jgi:hypothetical protein
VTLRGDAIVAEFISILDKYVASHYMAVDREAAATEEPVAV